MRSLKSLFLGTLLVVIYAVLDAALNLPFHQNMLCLGLATVAVLALLVNPICRRIPALKSFSRSEIAIVATMVLIGASLIGAGVPARIIAITTTLYSPQDDPLRQAWDTTIAPDLPDHLIMATTGSRASAQFLQHSLQEFETLRQNGAALETCQRQVNAELEELFRKHLQLEANAYGCKPTDIAAIRARQEELTRKLIQITRTLNELKTDPRIAGYTTLEQAVALNQKMAALNAEKSRCAQELQAASKQLEALFQKPKQQELPKIAAVKLDIQNRQATLTQLTAQIRQTKLQADEKLEQARKNWRLLQETSEPAQRHIQYLTSPEEAPQPITSFHQLRETLSAIPWSLWINPLLAWGILLALAIIVIHNLAILLTRQWAIANPDSRPDFPLARIIHDALPNDERHQGLNLLHRPCFYVGMAIGLAWILGTRFAFPQGFAYCWQDKVSPALQPAAAELALAFSLIPFAIAIILPRKLTASLWSMQLLVAVVLAVTGAALVSLQTGEVACESMKALLDNGKGTWVFGATAFFAVALLCEAAGVIFCAFHPYDIPHTKRAERRDLTHASAYFLLAVIAMFLAFNLIVDLTMEAALAAMVLFLMAITILMRLSAETGLFTLPGFSHLTWFHSLPCLHTASIPLTLSLFTIPAHNPLTALLPHTVKLRNDTRTNYAFYQLAVILATIISIAVATYITLGMAYTQRLPQKCLLTMTETQELFTSLALGDALKMTYPMLLMGVTFQLVLILLRTRLPWLPHPIAVICLAFPCLRQAWLPLLLGWLLSALVARFMPQNHQDRLRAMAIGALSAALLLGSLLP